MIWVKPIELERERKIFHLILQIKPVFFPIADCHFPISTYALCTGLNLPCTQMPYQSLVASWDREMFQGFTVAINLAMLAGPTSPKKSSYPVPIKESNWFVIVLQIIISTSRTGMRYCEHLSCRNSIFISSDRFLVAIRPLSVPFSNSHLRKMNLTAKQARLLPMHLEAVSCYKKSFSSNDSDSDCNWELVSKCFLPWWWWWFWWKLVSAYILPNLILKVEQILVIF